MRHAVALALALALSGCSALLGLDSPQLVIDAANPVGDAAPDALPGDALADTPAGTCPASYTYVSTMTDSRYRFISTTMTWTTAAQTCANDVSATTGDRRTHLVVIADEAERTAIADANGGVFWIGLSDINTEGSFRWVTGEPVGGYPAQTSGAWGAGEPTGGLNVDCVATTSSGQFQDATCTATAPVLCECDVYPDDPSRYTP
jgi:hypothetical protein